MAFQTVNDTAEVVLRYAMNGQYCTMTFYARKGGGYNQEALDDLAEAMDGWAAANFIPTISNQGSYVGTFVKGLEFLNDQEAQNFTSAGAGTLTGQPLSNALAFAIKRRSIYTGRSARGRIYYPLNSSHVAGNEDYVLSTEAEAIVDNLNLIRPLFSSILWEEVIVSRYSQGALRPVGITYPVVEYLFTDLEIDTQRRRMPSK